MFEIKKNTVTVVTLFYNAEKYFERCLRSLFEQDFNDIEYIFINNCSTDRSLTILHQTIKEYPHRKNQIIIHNNEKNMGYCYSMNKGIELATGEYTTFVDSDDWIEKEGIRTYYEFAKSKDYDIIFFDNYIDELDGNCRLRKNQISSGTNFDYIKKMLESHVLMEGTFWTKLYKTTFLKESGIRMYQNNVAWSDLCFNIRLFSLTNHIGCLKSAYYHYCQNEGQTTASWRINIEKKRKSVKEEIANLNFTISFLKEKEIINKCQPELDIRKLFFRQQILEPWNFNSVLKWYETYPETNYMIKTSNQISKTEKFLFLFLQRKLFILFYVLYGLKYQCGNIKRHFRK